MKLSYFLAIGFGTAAGIVARAVWDEWRSLTAAPEGATTETKHGD